MGIFYSNVCRHLEFIYCSIILYLKHYEVIKKYILSLDEMIWQWSWHTHAGSGKCYIRYMLSAHTFRFMQHLLLLKSYSHGYVCKMYTIIASGINITGPVETGHIHI